MSDPDKYQRVLFRMGNDIHIIRDCGRFSTASWRRLIQSTRMSPTGC
jgi:hypothetical protein